MIPETTLATVPLTFPKKGYRQVGKDDILHMLLPQRTLYPNSKIYVPVFLEQPENEHGPISAIVIRYIDYWFLRQIPRLLLLQKPIKCKTNLSKM